MTCILHLRRTFIKFYNATLPGDDLGLIQNGSVTEANFLEMLGILLITETPIQVQERGSGHIVTRANNQIEPGEYDVYCDKNEIQVNNESWVNRLLSHNVSGRDGAFTTGVRSRDGRCVISGLSSTYFPLNAESVWNEPGITDMDDTNGVFNSLQNGLLLRRDIHIMFDQYLKSVNPDGNYKIVVFRDDLDGLDGGVLDPVCRDPNNVHRSVLANMRGAGEPIFEHDFSAGDMIGVIRREKYGKERLEMEVAARLRGFVNV
ncbi:hypothetical protein L211DRAFT_856010 [Terfezia boudieri ATCC MYA-4762]|uniref:Uncharacterized protein n=1 Tax=Terfezia boudieri ATCC MYA-4762 TaxID=1051890 RepID=A0A3N4LW36_9PEZI|nr:hypothetical protein L211DRAFT_856010 [Terfezia boudieri ATCC MYA-4762]